MLCEISSETIQVKLIISISYFYCFLTNVIHFHFFLNRNNCSHLLITIYKHFLIKITMVSFSKAVLNNKETYKRYLVLLTK